MSSFCHLHCHTSYSLLDGAARVDTLVGKASELGMQALGITDHGNLYGVPEFYFAAKAANVDPVIGCEFYLCDSSMSERSDAKRYHQVLWAKSEEGYRNLLALSSKSFLEGFYYKPRIDFDTLAAHSQGLVATTCCLQGQVPQRLLRGEEKEALALFERYRDVFGADYYIELQNHGLEDQARANKTLVAWAQELGVPVVATNDVHYVARADHGAQDMLLCLQTGKALDDSNRLRFEKDEFYLKDEDEMRDAMAFLPNDLRQQALEATFEIAEKCRFELSTAKLLMPHYPLPAEFGKDMDAYLRHLVFEGARRRWTDVSPDVESRLNHELGIIREMGYAGYFLIVEDFTTQARKMGVSVGPARGSAAGSAVAFCLEITNIDPLKYDLLFERFLNPERISMPDIDIDFDDRGRSKVIDYVVEKYGRENVCQIITFGSMGAKTVIRDIARVLDIPLKETDRIAKLIPEGPKVTLDTAIEAVPGIPGAAGTMSVRKSSSLCDMPECWRGPCVIPACTPQASLSRPDMCATTSPWRRPRTRMAAMRRCSSASTMATGWSSLASSRWTCWAWRRSPFWTMPAKTSGRTVERGWTWIPSPWMTKRPSSCFSRATPRACSSLKAMACDGG